MCIKSRCEGHKDRKQHQVEAKALAKLLALEIHRERTPEGTSLSSLSLSLLSRSLSSVRNRNAFVRLVSQSSVFQIQTETETEKGDSPEHIKILVLTLLALFHNPSRHLFIGVLLDGVGNLDLHILRFTSPPSLLPFPPFPPSSVDRDRDRQRDRQTVRQREKI